MHTCIKPIQNREQVRSLLLLCIINVSFLLSECFLGEDT